ncbi:MAG TPA: enoyl-CoA hydratase-related protein [Thermoanaerobaculaceae bacterium]|nr:enoyl-CoA hydratase-related protein [Thermoanaerobaculaceae bacterium]
MTFANLLYRDVNGVRWITINRPAKLNALNVAVLDELEQAFAAVEAEPAVRAAVLTGAGEKAFVAGADIAEFQGLSAAAGQALARRGQELFAAIAALDKPVIAAVNGFALGGGCELAMACHLRVAASSAKFGQPEVKLGLIPGYGGTQRLPRLVGRARALELLLTGRPIDAATALQWGLVNRVVEPAELQSAAQALAEETLAVSPAAVARCLEAVETGLDLPLGRAEQMEAALFGLCFATDDLREGVAAFLEKRPPRFTGR